ncbi:MAG: Methyl-accepting chemotaxis protein signaling domain protein [Firmicutes bacterium]|nr:Methyl-accepting chemotaxis protein signaling domain protein [Bacillota bacterium]
MKLAVRLVIFFLTVILISVIGSTMVYVKISNSIASANLVEKTYLPKIAISTRITSNSLGQVADARGYLLFGSKSLLDDYYKASQENDQLERELLDSASTAEAKGFIEELIAQDERYSEIFENRVLPLKQAGKNAEALQLASQEMAPVGQKLISAGEKYHEGVLKKVQEACKQSTQAATEAQTVAIVATIIAAIVGIVIALFASRTITKPLHMILLFAHELSNGNFKIKSREIVRKDEIGQVADALLDMNNRVRELLRQISEAAEQLAASSEQLTASADQSAQASNQIAGSITEVAKGADQQLAATGDTVEIIHQLSENIKQMADDAGQVTEQSIHTADKANEGSHAIGEAVKQMAHINTTVSASAKVITSLGERSREIGQIVATISGIAGQTNLLALNAAIEAARAGEQGRGFAVVAEEVRMLAEQSDNAAQQIATLINEIQTETERAVEAMNDGTREVQRGTEIVDTSGQNFQEIVAYVNQVTEKIKEISGAIEELSTGSSRMVETVDQINMLSKTVSGESQTVSAATEEQSASMQEIAGASQSLSKLAMNLRDAVSQFKI